MPFLALTATVRTIMPVREVITAEMPSEAAYFCSSVAASAGLSMFGPLGEVIDRDTPFRFSTLSAIFNMRPARYTWAMDANRAAKRKATEAATISVGANLARPPSLACWLAKP